MKCQQAFAKEVAPNLPDFLQCCAPTGSASYNIEGETIHKLLNLPINYKADDPIPKLKGDALMQLQERMEGVHILIIDEMSMISKITLFQISERLKEAFPHNADQEFGGITIVLMGDPAQLPPVKAKPMYEVNVHLLKVSIVFLLKLVRKYLNILGWPNDCL